MPDDEVDGFLSPKEERERDEAEKGKVHLPKFAPPQPFDGTMKETKSFVSSLIVRGLIDVLLVALLLSANQTKLQQVWRSWYRCLGFSRH